MSERKSIKKRFKAALAAGAVITGLAFVPGGAIEASAREISLYSSSVTLNENGYAIWSLIYGENMFLDRYELRLARNSNGIWDYDYQTATAYDNDYWFTFPSPGQYFLTVRAIFKNGDYSAWSYPPSELVNVTYYDTGYRGDGEDVPWDHFPYEYPYTSLNGYGPGGGGSAPDTRAPGSYAVYSEGKSYYVDKSGNIIDDSGSNGGAPGSYNPAPQSAYAGGSGWIREGANWKYRRADGTYAQNRWEYIGGSFYFFDPQGRMSTGWVYYNGKWYLCDLDGRMCTGWHMVNGKWYYMDAAGVMQTGYITDGTGATYYCDQSGARFEGGYNPDGHYFDNRGVMIK